MHRGTYFLLHFPVDDGLTRFARIGGAAVGKQGHVWHPYADGADANCPLSDATAPAIVAACKQARVQTVRYGRARRAFLLRSWVGRWQVRLARESGPAIRRSPPAVPMAVPPAGDPVARASRRPVTRVSRRPAARELALVPPGCRTDRRRRPVESREMDRAAKAAAAARTGPPGRGMVERPARLGRRRGPVARRGRARSVVLPAAAPAEPAWAKAAPVSRPSSTCSTVPT